MSTSNERNNYLFEQPSFLIWSIITTPPRIDRGSIQLCIREKGRNRMVTNSIQRVSTGYVRITFIRYALGYVVIISVDVNYIMWDARVYRLLEYRHNASPWYNGYRATCGTLPSNFPPPFLAVRIFMAGESQLCSLQGASISESNRIFNIRRFFLRFFVSSEIWKIK